jgi:hypothetical protein
MVLDSFIKLFAPFIFLALWVSYISIKRSFGLSLVALFFASYAGFSQNFEFFYREFHQLIQIVMMFYIALIVIKRRSVKNISLIPVSLFVLIIISLLVSGLDEDARQQLINYIVCIFVVLLIYTSIKSDDDFESLIIYLAKLGVASALIGIFEFIVTGSDRIEGTFANPNYYALFIAVAFCIVWERYRGPKRGIYLAFIVAALVLSGSRSALIFPILAFAWSVYRARDYRLKFGILFSSALALVILLYSGSSRLTDIDASNASDAERMGFSKIALSMANDYPYSGVGWGRFISEFSNYSTVAERVSVSGGLIDVASHERRVTHNDLLRILAELGWIAFFAALATIFYGVFLLWRSRASKFGYILPIWVGFIAFSMTHNNMNTAFFWFFFLMPFLVFRKPHLNSVAAVSTYR